MEYELTYAHTVAEGAALAERLRGVADRSGRLNLGFDTEFYDVRIGKESTVARAKVHLASLAWLEGGERFHPRGFTIPRAAVVSRQVVTQCKEFRTLFQDRRLFWFAHNAPVDAHSMKNEGIEVYNVINTLTRARWAHPGRARGAGFTLDALGQDLLGEGKLDTFSDIFKELHETWKEYTRTWKSCECGAVGCRRRVAGHTKLTRHETIREPVVGEREVPLQDVIPGHRLWERALLYSAQDAVLAHCLAQVLSRTIQQQERLVPWLPKFASTSSPEAS